MDATLIVPLAAKHEPERDAAWEYLEEQWRTTYPGLDIVEGIIDGPWCKATAVEAALPDVTTETIIIADADVWTDSIPWALGKLDTHNWVIPHRDVHRLTKEATARFLQGQALPEAPLEQDPYIGYAGGGIVVTTITAYEHAPLDPRFIGWGYEDQAWSLAMRTLIGNPARGNTPLYHLWHPPQPRPTRAAGSDKSRRIYREYKRAAHNPLAMRAVINRALTETPHQPQAIRQ